MKVLFAVIHLLMTLVLYVIGVAVIGCALVPATLLVRWAGDLVLWHWGIGQVVTVCLAMAAAFFVFGLTLMFLVGFLNMLLGLRLREGFYRAGQPETLKWFFVNAMFLCVRNVFMDFILLTPFCSIFYRMMGAKLGLGVQINSKSVADLSLLEIGEGTVIGGNATVIGHIFERGGIRLKKVKIGKNVVVGLNSVIMPGVEIGDGAIVAAGAIVPKGTVIAAKTVFRGREQEGHA
ncbi:MAG: hypothetical protein HQL18_01615 [Candidatus Omnitrophica bacterium]|nr:hypothetical protein [Candidatus Omnitrophota bacterium]